MARLALLAAVLLPAANALVVQNRFWAKQIPHLPALFGGALPEAPGIEGVLVFPIAETMDSSDSGVLGCTSYHLPQVHMVDPDTAHNAHPMELKRIAMVERGGCTFVEKAMNAQAAGADALIVFNNGEPIAFMGASDEATAQEVTIPVVEITTSAGHALFNSAMQTATFVALFDEGDYSGASAIFAYSRHRMGLLFTIGMGLVAIFFLIALTCACIKCVRLCCCSNARRAARAESTRVPTQEIVTGIVVKDEKIPSTTGAPLLNGEPIIIAVPYDNVIQI
jgi:hypothetical protein